MPAERIDIKSIAQPKGLELSCARFESHINGTDAEDFPPIPTVESGVAGKVEPEVLKDAIAHVAGGTITAADMLEVWLHLESNTVQATIQELVLSRIYQAESERLGVVLDPGLAAQAMEAVEVRLSKEVERANTGLSVEEFIRRRLGLNPEGYMPNTAHSSGRSQHPLAFPRRRERPALGTSRSP